MAARVVGLGHIGLYVDDLDNMVAFYRDFLGMQVTKTSDIGVFFSADPERSDHEIAIFKGRPSLDDPHLVQQISMQVETLDDLRDFVGRIRERGFKIDGILSHASAIGCYFRDPEGNPTEVFWHTGLASWAILAIPIDIDRSDDEVMADVHAAWDVVRDVQMGQLPDPDTAAEMRATSGLHAVLSPTTDEPT